MANLSIEDRAKINQALAQIAEMKNQLRLLEITIRPLSTKTVKRPLRSADGRHDYTKTSILNRLNR
jgi:hypothetical protein